ncbi:hypothetical protein [Streptomyces sp. NPDC054834]
MTSYHGMLWVRCTLLGRVLLPLVDQEPWLRFVAASTCRAGQRQLIEVFVALAAHAVAVDASVSPAQFDALPLSAVAEAAIGKQDFELLAGLPGTFADDRDELAVEVFRLYTYRGSTAFSSSD